MISEFKKLLKKLCQASLRGKRIQQLLLILAKVINYSITINTEYYIEIITENTFSSSKGDGTERENNINILSMIKKKQIRGNEVISNIKKGRWQLYWNITTESVPKYNCRNIVHALSLMQLTHVKV